jgi:hypothetical protein
LQIITRLAVLVAELRDIDTPQVHPEDPAWLASIRQAVVVALAKCPGPRPKSPRLENA